MKMNLFVRKPERFLFEVVDKLEKENAELKTSREQFRKDNEECHKKIMDLHTQIENYKKEVEEFASKYNRNEMIKFCAHVVHKLANPESTMCVPNAIFIKVENMLDEWELAE